MFLNCHPVEFSRRPWRCRHADVKEFEEVVRDGADDPETEHGEVEDRPGRQGPFAAGIIVEVISLLVRFLSALSEICNFMTIFRTIIWHWHLLYPQ